MLLKQLFSETSALLGIRKLQLSENNELCLAFDDVIVAIDASEEKIILSTKLANIPKVKEELKYDFLLKMSCFGALNAYIGLDELQEAITYTTKLDMYYLDAQSFAHSLEDHVRNVQLLRENLEELDTLTIASKSPERIEEYQFMLKV